MRMIPGRDAPRIQLPAVDGSSFDTRMLSGRPYMLSFFRFASCPLCNMRVRELMRRYDELAPGFSIVAVFASPLAELQRFTQTHAAPFPILADESKRYYREYGIESSVRGFLRGMVLRLPTALSGMLRGYLPLKWHGSLTTMPVDFLIDRNGVIREAYYGRDDGDHMPIETVPQFSALRD